MADSPLNHSWPSFSKLWMKRWSFKRALALPSTDGHGVAETLTANKTYSDALTDFSDTDRDTDDTYSVVSDYDCPCAEVNTSVEDLLSSSLKDSEYFKDLEGGIPALQFTAPPVTTVPESKTLTVTTQVSLNTDSPAINEPLTTHSPQVNAPRPAFYIHAAEEPHHNFVVTQLSPKLLPGCIIDSSDSSGPAVGLSLTINLNGLLGTMEPEKGITESEEVQEETSMDLEGEIDLDSFPILVRSMSTSRRHSWGVPMSPINLGRRLSLDTMNMDSDGEKEDNEEGEKSISQSTQEQSNNCTACPEDEIDGPKLRFPCPRARVTSMAGGVARRQLYSRSEILATDECSRAAHISRVVQTSKQAARAAGAEEFDPEENLHSTEGQSHMLMVQKVLQELKLYHGAKQRNNRSETKESGNVTWYEFLSKENDDDEDRTEKVEKGTKVKRTLSSLRNRVTGSFNKDKGKNREKEQQKEKGKEAKEKVCRSDNTHDLMPGSFSSCATCSLCSKTLQKKHGLQCMNMNQIYLCETIPHPSSMDVESDEVTKSNMLTHTHRREKTNYAFLSADSDCRGSCRRDCAVNVHKSCKSLLGECTSSKNKRDSLHRTGPSGSPNLVLKDRDREREQLGPASSQVLDGHQGFLTTPGMTISPWGSSTQPTAAHTTSSTAASASSFGHSLHHNNSSGSLPGEMDETDALRSKRCNDDAISLAPSTTESIIVEDPYYVAVRADLECDAQDLEAESWSLAVDQQHVKKLSKEAVKRQDVIYELMQTEMHHVRTAEDNAARVRPGVEGEPPDGLGQTGLSVPPLGKPPRASHTFPVSSQRAAERKPRLTQRQELHYQQSCRHSDRTGEIGDRMKDSYGDFCSHHTEAVSYYKEQLHNNKKFQNIIRKINNLSIVRRLGVSECILLVTQRITKYPVLVERILHNTEAGTEEHEDLTRALGLIKDTIVQVDTLVNLHEKDSRLRDIHNRMELKALGKIKDGRVFRREDLAQGRRRLLHEGTVNWKAASGRLKDILAVLLSDVLLLLQEKDQRYVFATVDNKPSVISLQKLIVREVAHEEKAMFLICASSSEPEMYEIHTTSKEERNSWMTHIRQAVESCPHTEERLFSEEEEARAFRFKEFQERLSQKDAVIVQALTEKLQMFADMAESVAGIEDTASRTRLLLRGDASDLQQGEALLKGAITEVENLQNLLQSGVREEAPSSRLEEGSGSGVLPRRADTFGGYDSSPTILNKSESSTVHPQKKSTI
ncbi:Rho guanine nucleotide exchange factor 18 [Larimichthys crocea]|uniref:Uncharacterized protein n=1 Tax=Larimichthys crocea TaxID=215358 RepID=A0ACD3RN94_LARCR|nr:Rho guanine nucleotide exchange factor 18 [Larimichthys crocea]